jgi:hypothetical protein
VTKISAFAFYHCTALESIEVPDTVTEIGASAFGGCTALVSMTLPFVGKNATDTTPSLSTLFGYIFGTEDNSLCITAEQFYTGSKTQVYNKIPRSLESVKITGGNILHGAFIGCSLIKKIEVCGSVSEIGSWAFGLCSNLQYISLADTQVATIGAYAFYNCNKMEYIILPTTLTKFGEHAFQDTNKVSILKAYYCGNSTQWADVNKGLYNYSLCTDNCSYGNSYDSVYFYTESATSSQISSGKYWHYVDGKPAIWS